ncbi:Tar ligand binding domain-containing protein, partial [Mixta sp. Marseille-Q2659]|uniref:Tar ligand binding domain-containing protein n=1 Tax=Mixta sp. Marseille-Q2659 TaxID=2736607 RepID=UPI0023B8A828
MQLLSGGLFFHALNKDKENFSVSQTSSQNIAALTDAWIALNQTRITLNRGMLRLQSDMASNINGGALDALVQQSRRQLAEADKHYRDFKAIPNTPGLDDNLSQRMEEKYNTLAKTLADMADLLAAKQLEAMFKQNIEQKQDEAQAVYTEWRSAQAVLTAKGIAENESAFNTMLWILGTVMTLVVAVIVLCWFGLKSVLLQPLQKIMQHIQAIAAGDLTQPIEVEGRNEMSLLAASLKNMQQELVRTVSDVRDGSDAIYTGASEITAGSNDLSSRTEQQAASLE